MALVTEVRVEETKRGREVTWIARGKGVRRVLATTIIGPQSDKATVDSFIAQTHDDILALPRGKRLGEVKVK